MITVDLETAGVRSLNERLHKLSRDTNETLWRVVNPMGAHAVAVGVTAPIQIEIDGHVGYYCASMNTDATVTVNGSAFSGEIVSDDGADVQRFTFTGTVSGTTASIEPGTFSEDGLNGNCTTSGFYHASL